MRGIRFANTEAEVPSMNQNKNTQGQQNWDKQKQSQGQQDPHQQKQNPGPQTPGSSWQSQNPDRDPAEGSRDRQPRQPGQSQQERGTGTGNERNSGISNRGMDSDSEQEDLPERGSER